MRSFRKQKRGPIGYLKRKLQKADDAREPFEWYMNKKLVEQLQKFGKITSDWYENTWKCVLGIHHQRIKLSLILRKFPKNVKTVKCAFLITAFDENVMPTIAGFPIEEEHTFQHGYKHSKLIDIGSNEDVLYHLANTKLTINIQILDGKNKTTIKKLEKFNGYLPDYTMEEKFNPTPYQKIPLNLPDHERLNLVIEQIYILHERCYELQQENEFLKRQNEEQQYAIEELQTAKTDDLSEIANEHVTVNAMETLQVQVTEASKSKMTSYNDTITSADHLISDNKPYFSHLSDGNALLGMDHVNEGQKQHGENNEFEMKRLYI